MGSLRLVAIVLLLGSPAFAQSSPTYGVGRAPTAEEIRALDISIGPTGEELPAGRGTVKEGAVLFEEKGCSGADEVYALTAYLLFLNKVIPEDGVLDKQSLPKVKMPHGNDYTQLPDWKPRTPRLQGYPY
jgi:hypothetical protein